MKARAFMSVLLLAAAPAMALSQELDHPGTPLPESSGEASLEPTWGTTDVEVVRVPASAFVPLDSGTGFNGNTFGYRWRTSGGGYWFEAPVHLPVGAKVVGLEYDGYDGSNIFSGGVTFVHCPAALGYLCTESPNGWLLTSGSGGWQKVFANLESAGIVIAADRTHYLRVTLADGSSIQVRSIAVSYRLQVSPAPGTASFSDVPLGHPFFQYVEALAASGITAGCGGGRYCPDTAVTRGQMAVFLAKALGLHWF